MNQFWKKILWAVIPIGLGVGLVYLIILGVEELPKKIKFNKEKMVTTANVSRDFSLDFGNLGEKISSVFAKRKTVSIGTNNSISFGNLTYPPQASYHVINDNYEPDVGAISYVVGDVDTGEIILEKNDESIFPIASVTKLMTALVSLEEIDQEAMTKVSLAAVNTYGSSGNLRRGENFQVSDLLYPLLLVSSNDSGEVIAESDGRDNFIQRMNEWAVKIGMEKTNYNDTSGLSEENVSTAKDLFTLAHYLNTNHPRVFNITGLKQYSINGHTWTNTNRFLKKDNYIGGKTGFTNKAQKTGVFLFKVPFEGYGERNIGISILRSDNRTRDVEQILNYLETNVAYGYPEEIKTNLRDRILGVTDEKDEYFEERIFEEKSKNCPKSESKTLDLDLILEKGGDNNLGDYIPSDLIEIQDNVDTNGRIICLREEVADSLEKLMEDAQDSGVHLVVTSGFRSFETQKILHENWHKNRTEVNGLSAVAEPGHSEHQLGTTVDFTSPGVGYASAHRSFHLTEEYEWLQTHAHRYGFVLSYPDNKDTGYIFEPWHWRYIGIEDAYKVKAGNFSLLDFLFGDFRR